MALVIKNWAASIESVDKENNNVVIVGREGGLVSWLFTTLEIDVTTTIKVSPDRIEYRASSLAGTEQRMIPVSSLSSAYYGYHKPWKKALAIIVSGLILTIWLTSAFGGGVIFSLILFAASLCWGAVYYFLNKHMTLGFVEKSGVVSGISFKQSIIENQKIGQDEARRVCEIIQLLVDVKLN